MRRMPRGIPSLLLDPLRHPFDWHGRTSRRRYWAFCTIAFALIAAAAIAEYLATGEGWRPLRYVWPVSAALIPAALGNAVRRFHDTGRSGRWSVFLFVPVVGLLAQGYLLFAPAGRPYRSSDLSPPMTLLAMLATVALMLLVASRLVWAPYVIVAGSMEPTLMAGDHVFVRTPFRYAPARGDVILFWLPEKRAVFAKRVIAVAGDRVQMRGGLVILNGTALPQEPAEPFTTVMAPTGPNGARPTCANAPVGEGGLCTTPRFRERLPDGQSHEILDLGPRPLDDTAEVTVPPGAYFVLGDSRDNSVDSRIAAGASGSGLVPHERIIGRAAGVGYSFSGPAPYYFWTFRPARLFKRVM